MPEPETIDVDVTTPHRMEASSTAWHAWWENHEWDGDALYATLNDATIGAAQDYRDTEYGYPDEADDDEMPKPVLQWRWQFSRWALYDGGVETGVELFENEVLAKAEASR